MSRPPCRCRGGRGVRCYLCGCGRRSCGRCCCVRGGRCSRWLRWLIVIYVSPPPIRLPQRTLLKMCRQPRPSWRGTAPVAMSSSSSSMFSRTGAATSAAAMAAARPSSLLSPQYAMSGGSSDEDLLASMEPAVSRREEVSEHEEHLVMLGRWRPGEWITHCP